MSEGEMCDLSIIIVNWNTRGLLRKCLRSIYNNTKKLTFEVFVIDNASRDGSVEMVKKEFPQARLARNKENLGFARGNNQGFLQTKGKYVLVLNPDTEVIDDVFLKMVEYLKSNKEVGAVGPRFIYPDGTFQRYHYRFPTFISILTTWFLPRSVAYKLRPTRAYLMLDDDFSKVIEVPQPAGSCLMVRRGLFSEEDFMDEQFPIFFNDVDLCRRIYKKGLKIFVLPEAEIVHYKGKGGLEQGKKSLFLSAEYFLSMIDYFSKYEGAVKADLLRIFISLGFLIRTIAFFIGYICRLERKEEFRYEAARFHIFLWRKYVFSRKSSEKDRKIKVL